MEFKNGILFADEGKIVTDGKTYGRQIHRLNDDMAKNWYEITEEEYQAILKEQEEEISGGNNDHEVMSEDKETE
jgi:hypothetical protein